MKKYSIILFVFLNLFFVNATNTIELNFLTTEIEKQTLKQRTELAEQNLIIQERNYKLFSKFALVLILGFISFLFYNQKRLKNIQLQKENELKDALVKIETQNKLQEQRLRISRDLHNNIGAQLTFIISSIDNLKYGFDIKDDKLTKKLDSISNFTSSTIYELRDTIWAMNKNEITFEDIKTRITNYIDKARIASSNIDFEFNTSNEIDNNKAFTSLEGINIHRVIQEAINNSLKHAEAYLVSVDIKKIGSAIEINISDNGKGFDVATTQQGNGLMNMKKRIHEIDGDFKIITSKNQGTQIVITI